MSLSVYVAGKTHDFETIRRVQDVITRKGGSITYNWTDQVEATGADHENGIDRAAAQRAAINDFRGTREADLVIAVPNPAWCMTLMEIGAAISERIPVLLLGQPFQRSIAWSMPGVFVLRDGDSADRFVLLGRLVERLLQRPSGRRYVLDELEFLFMQDDGIDHADIEGHGSVASADKLVDRVFDPDQPSQTDTRRLRFGEASLNRPMHGGYPAGDR